MFETTVNYCNFQRLPCVKSSDMNELLQAVADQSASDIRPAGEAASKKAREYVTDNFAG